VFLNFSAPGPIDTAVDRDVLCCYETVFLRL